MIIIEYEFELDIDLIGSVLKFIHDMLEREILF